MFKTEVQACSTPSRVELIELGKNTILSLFFSKNIARIANAVSVTLYSRVTVNLQIVVINCQKCNQCLKGQTVCRIVL